MPTLVKIKTNLFLLSFLQQTHLAPFFMILPTVLESHGEEEMIQTYTYTLIHIAYQTNLPAVHISVVLVSVFASCH